MKNPYKPPESELGELPDQPKSKYIWKIYFWLFFVITSLSFLDALFHPQDQRAWVLAIDFIVYPLIICGVYGFAYNKRVFFKKLGPMVLIVGVLWDGYMLYELTTEIILEGESSYIVVGFLMVILPLVALQYFALYFYSYRSEEIWGKS